MWPKIFHIKSIYHENGVLWIPVNREEGIDVIYSVSYLQVRGLVNKEGKIVASIFGSKSTLSQILRYVGSNGVIKPAFNR